MSYQEVSASYTETYVFNVPKGIDLNDTSKVKFWGIRYNTLSIQFVDGTEMEIEPAHQLDTDYEEPISTDLEEVEIDKE
jgi:hypothetical protein